MKHALFIVALTFAACTPAAPRYQTSTSADGQTITRIDTQTGKTEILVRGQWRPIAEAEPPSARPKCDPGDSAYKKLGYCN